MTTGRKPRKRTSAGKFAPKGPPPLGRGTCAGCGAEDVVLVEGDLCAVCVARQHEH